MIVFVHIPKTAGTSFGKALSSQYGSEKVWYDYSLSFSKTSEPIAEYVHKEHDMWALKMLADSKGIRVISGHYPAVRYQSIYGVTEYCTFFRDPIQRVYSEYCHRKKRSFDRFDGSFEDYCKVKNFCNVQSRHLKGAIWPAFGFLGVTEFYSESLEMFEGWQGVSLDSVEENKNASKKGAAYSLTDDERKIATETQRQDITLYDSAVVYFKERLKAFRGGYSVANGQVTISKEGAIKGFAFFNDGKQELEHVTVEVLVNGEVVGFLPAKEYRKDLRLIGAPKNGYVGFSKNLSLKSGDIVSARVAESGQYLANGAVRKR
ncbi:MAG: sulfotransferase family 2 domain-containing protein [Halomonas sp.]|nr:sulfotransferase family 2 domain-containing protein [Halomonas sp.]MDN6336759.1 sulfotransferase family 2 domain-containing protein [Halomonas sp.]